MEKEREKDKMNKLSDSLSKWLKAAWLSQAKAWSLELYLNLPSGARA